MGLDGGGPVVGVGVEGVEERLLDSAVGERVVSLGGGSSQEESKTISRQAHTW